MPEVMTIDRSRNLKQSQRLVTARYHLSTFEQRMLIAICSQIEDDAQEFKPVRVRVVDIAEFCGLSGNDKYKRIHQALVKLMSRTLQLQNDDGKWYVTHWLQSAEYLGGGLIEYCLDQRLKRDFLQLKTTYFSTPAAPLMKFKREYSARFYFIFQKGPKGQAFDLELDFIREIFQLGETYKQFSNIKDRIIEPAIRELNEQSDLQIFHKYIKTGRTYSILRFVVTSKNSEIVTISHKPLSESDEEISSLEPKTIESETKTAASTAPAATSPVAPPPKPPEVPKVNTAVASTANKPPQSEAMPANKPVTGNSNPTERITPPKPPEAPKVNTAVASTANKPPQSEAAPANKPVMSEAAQLAARMMDANRWKLSIKMVQKLLKRYGLSRVKANLSYAEGHTHPEYKGGSWLIHCIVTDNAGQK